MPDPDVRFTRSQFDPHEHSFFAVQTEDVWPVELELIEVTDTTPKDFDGEQFSLVFRGPHEPALGQRIFKLEHNALGSIELFLVPIGAPEKGRLYEAYFNLRSRSEE
jgi:hypothetical protein